MAEKYGTIPPRFTKAWWSYFWDYYKWHTIISLFVLLLIAHTIYSSLTAPKYDMTLFFAGNIPFDSSEAQKIEDALSPLCEDIDKNGEKSLYFSPLFIDTNSKDAEYTTAMNTKLHLEFATGDNSLFILNKELADVFSGEDESMTSFTPLAEWLSVDTDAKTYTAHGEEYGVCIQDFKIFKDLGVDLSDYYLFIRFKPADKRNFDSSNQRNRCRNKKCYQKGLNEPYVARLP